MNPQRYRSLVTILSVLSGAGTCGVPAIADTVIYSETYDNFGAGYGVSYADAFYFPEFDDLGGTRILTKVELLGEAYSWGGRDEYDNEAPVPGTATVAIGVEVKFEGPSALIVRPEPLTSRTDFVASDSDGIPPDFVGFDALSVDGPSATLASFGLKTKTITSDLSPFIGTGDVLFLIHAITSTAGSSSDTGGGSFRVTTDDLRWRAKAYLAYTYTVVPEPSAFVLAVAACVGTLVLRRSQRRIT